MPRHPLSWSGSDNAKPILMFPTNPIFGLSGQGTVLSVSLLHIVWEVRAADHCRYRHIPNLLRRQWDRRAKWDQHLCMFLHQVVPARSSRLLASILSLVACPHLNQPGIFVSHDDFRTVVKDFCALLSPEVSKWNWRGILLNTWDTCTQHEISYN